MKFWQVVMFVKNRCSDFFYSCFFFFMPTLWIWALCVWMYNLWPSEYVDLFIPVFIHTCTAINSNQGKLRWNTNKRRVVRHDISFMDIAEKINVWASSLSITTFSYWGTKRHIWQLIPHCSWEILTAISFYHPRFMYTIVLIKPWNPYNFKEEILHNHFSGHMCTCAFAYFLLINILNVFNVRLTWRKVSSQGLCLLKNFKANECTYNLDSTKRLN